MLGRARTDDKIIHVANMALRMHGSMVSSEGWQSFHVLFLAPNLSPYTGQWIESGLFTIDFNDQEFW